MFYLILPLAAIGLVIYYTVYCFIKYVPKTEKWCGVISLVFAIVVCCPDFPNQLKYKYEKAFGTPSSFIWVRGIHVYSPGKSEDFSLLLYDYITIDMNRFSKDAKITVYGRIVNSYDTFYIVLDDRVVCNEEVEGSKGWPWNESYINADFQAVIPISGTGKHRMTFVCGYAVETIEFDFVERKHDGEG